LAISSRYRLVQRNVGGTPASSIGREPPNGFLFNERPLRAGERRQKESWENWWVYGLTFNFLLVIFSLVYKPDTFVSTWAHVEAVKQMKEEEGQSLVVESKTED
jgi:hypothetical protein